jgi:4-amino-4-deoxychorismate lyase
VTERGRAALLALAVGGRGLVDPEEPVLRADDDALLRGRAAFETLRVYGGSPFRLDDHIARLAASAERLGLPRVDPDAFRELTAVALAGAAAPDASLRLYWTPGREGAGRPTALALVSAIPPHLEEVRARGIAVVALSLGIDADRRQVAPWLLGGVKSTSYAVNMAAQQEARRRGSDDALFLSLEGLVLEGPTSNIWFREGRTLHTPALDLGILAGVTRDTLIGAATARGYSVAEGAYELDRLVVADEVFSSSSVREVVGVVAIDGSRVGGGAPGEAALELQQALRDAAAG